MGCAELLIVEHGFQQGEWERDLSCPRPQTCSICGEGGVARLPVRAPAGQNLLKSGYNGEKNIMKRAFGLLKGRGSCELVNSYG